MPDSVRTYVVGIKGNSKIQFAIVPEIKSRLIKLFPWLNSSKKNISPVEIAGSGRF